MNLGVIAATTRAVGTFSLDGSDPLIRYVGLGNVSAQPLIIQRIGTPLTASPSAQANTPPPLAPTGTAPALIPLSVIPVTAPATVPPFTPLTLASSQPQGISPLLLIGGAVLLLFIFLK